MAHRVSPTQARSTLSRACLLGGEALWREQSREGREHPRSPWPPLEPGLPSSCSWALPLETALGVPPCPAQLGLADPGTAKLSVGYAPAWPAGTRREALTEIAAIAPPPHKTSQRPPRRRARVARARARLRTAERILLPGDFDRVFDAVQDLEISRVDVSSLSFRCHHRRSALHANIPCA